MIFKFVCLPLESSASTHGVSASEENRRGRLPDLAHGRGWERSRSEQRGYDVKKLTILAALAAFGVWGCGDDGAGGSGGSGGDEGGSGGQGATGAGAAGAGAAGAGAAGGMGGAGGDASGGGGEAGAPPVCDAAALTAYESPDYATHATTSLALRSQLGALNGLMRQAEMSLAVTPSSEDLLALYEAGTPSLRDETTSFFDVRALVLFGYFEGAAGNVWVPADPPTGPGGKYGAYLFSADGIDLRQAVEKAVFGATMYNYALKVRAKTPFGLEELDELLAIYGAHPTFPGDSETMDMALVPFPDRIGAQYAERRSPKALGDTSQPLDPAAPGPYFRIKQRFLDAKAAIEAGPACDGAREEALDAILLEWEAAIGATVIYYLNDAFVKLTADNATETQLAAGLHSYGEAHAFITGWRGLPAGGRLITDAQIDEILSELGINLMGPSTAFELLTDSASAAPRLLTGIELVADVYGFTAADIDAFETNH
jgi:hypothetical protein